jgi:DNA-binding GntR family transcriptional regulator
VDKVIGAKLSEQLRERIEERIVVGEYLPGARLDEMELARTFGVSRTPIREALIQLASAGFVETRPRRGAVVAEISPERLRDMFEVMAELEAICARRVALRSLEAERNALVVAHRACEEAMRASDPDAYYHLNERFHVTVYGACHNQFLTEQATLLHRRLRPYRRLQLRLPGRMRTSFAEHADVVDAVVAGDAERAARVMRAHVEVQGERFADLVRSLRAVQQAAAPGSGGAEPPGAAAPRPRT